MCVPHTTHRCVPLSAATASNMVAEPKERRAVHDGSIKDGSERLCTEHRVVVVTDIIDGSVTGDALLLVWRCITFHRTKTRSEPTRKNASMHHPTLSRRLPFEPFEPFEPASSFHHFS